MNLCGETLWSYDYDVTMHIVFFTDITWWVQRYYNDFSLGQLIYGLAYCRVVYFAYFIVDFNWANAR